MTANQFRKALDDLGLTQAAAAEWLKLSIRADPRLRQRRPNSRTDGQTAAAHGQAGSEAGRRALGAESARQDHLAKLWRDALRQNK